MSKKAEEGSQKRVSNFPKAEDTLVSLVKKYGSKMESKVANAVMNAHKIKAWEALTDKLNSVFTNTHRDYKSLRIKYNNTKKD